MTGYVKYKKFCTNNLKVLNLKVLLEGFASLKLFMMITI